MAFTIYSYKVSERTHDRYFHSWENAKKMLQTELTGLLHHNWVILHHDDYFNSAKGFYVYQYELLTPNGEKAVLALINEYFSDAS